MLFFDWASVGGFVCRFVPFPAGVDGYGVRWFLANPGEGPGVPLGLVGDSLPLLADGLALVVVGGGSPVLCLLVLRAGVCVPRGARVFLRVVCVCGVCIGVGVGVVWVGGCALPVCLCGCECVCGVWVEGFLGACPRLSSGWGLRFWCGWVSRQSWLRALAAAGWGLLLVAVGGPSPIMAESPGSSFRPFLVGVRLWW